MIRRLVVVLTVVVVGLGGTVSIRDVASARIEPFDAVGEVSCRAAGNVKFSPGLKTAAQAVKTTFKASLDCTQGTTGHAGVTVVTGNLRGTGAVSSLACGAGTISAASATVKWKTSGGKVNPSSIAWSDGAFTLGTGGVLDFPGLRSSSVNGSYAGGGARLHLASANGPGAACSSRKGWKGFSFTGATSTFRAPDDAFYQPPAPLPPGNPGDVIRSQASSLYVGSTHAAVTAWRMLYRSTSATDNPVAVSGTVIVPNGSYPGTRPILVYTPPTVGNGDHCATSKKLPAGTELDGFAYGQALAHGWAIAVPDYEGLGTPGQHTYLVGRSEGHAVLDAARAATRLMAAGLSSTAPVAIWGYSQGGQAASWAAELQPTYAPELPLVGVAAGGVPVDPAAAVGSGDGGYYFGFVPSMLLGYDAAYPELNLDSFLTPAGRTAFAATATQCYEDYRPALSFRTLASLTTSNPFTNAAFQARFSENVLGGLLPAVPIHLFHGVDDEIVPYAQAVSLNTIACTAGVTIEFESLAGQNHFTSFPAGLGNTLSWIADRFAGAPAPNTC